MAPAKHAKRGKAHHIVGDFQHYVHHFIHGVHQRAGGLAVQMAQRQAKEQRKHQNLQNLIAGHGLDDALGEDMSDKVFQVQRAGFQVQPGGGFWQRHVQRVARVQHIGKNQADEQRAKRGADEPAQRPAADAAHRTGVTHARQASHQGGEHQRGDDHLDQAQKDIGEDAEIRGDFLGLRRRGGQGVAGITHNHPQHQGAADPGGQPVHFHDGFLSCHGHPPRAVASGKWRHKGQKLPIHDRQKMPST